MIKIKRAYDVPARDDGPRFLVDRLWPRGLKKDTLKLASWEREAAPSDALRRWYHHETQKWAEFKRRYFAELDQHPTAWEPILQAARQGDITLVYSSKERELNNAVALKAYLENRLESS